MYYYIALVLKIIKQFDCSKDLLFSWMETWEKSNSGLQLEVVFWSQLSLGLDDCKRKKNTDQIKAFYFFI